MLCSLALFFFARVVAGGGALVVGIDTAVGAAKVFYFLLPLY